MVSEVFGKEPDLDGQVGRLSIASALDQIKNLSPAGTPLFMVLHDAGSEKQFMEFFVQQPRKLIYSENYQFDIQGNFLGSSGFIDGSPGKQTIYSMYRLHFGHYLGLSIKLLYGILGLALTVVSVSGINIWLAKRKTRDLLNPLWAGFVWGLPLSLTLAAITQVLWRIPSMQPFFGRL